MVGMGVMRGLNAPFGARCFLTRAEKNADGDILISLNAPFGARCFLTVGITLLGEQII